MTTERDEADFRKVIEEQSAAIAAKDIERILAPYAANVVVYDIKPPFQLRGIDAVRQMWAECLPYMPPAFRFEKGDLAVTVGDGVASACWVQRVAGVEPGHPADGISMRVSVTCRKVEGRWRIVHEHVSVPYDPRTGKAVTKPEA